jgi:peroxiredoxin
MRKAPLIAVLVLAALAGAASAWWLNRDAAPEKGLAERPAFSLPDLDNRVRKVAEWDGKVVLLNFWAPWCPPCRHEIPAFMDLSRKYAKQGLTVVGVTIDTEGNARKFVDTYGIDYPILVGGEQGVAIAKAYGNKVGALPYTVVIDREGRIRYMQGGELSYKAAEKIVKPLL